MVTPNTKAIIAVHLAGWPCDMQPMVEFARARGIKVIEDCAQAQGATYHGRPVGSLADMAAFSFCQDKIVSTGGEGGMIVTSNAALWEQAWSFKDHGKNYHLCHDWQPSAGYRWIHESFGTNLRMTEMQSAIGRVLLRKLDQHLEIRRRHAAILTEAFSKLPALRVTRPPDTIQHAYYKYYVFLRPEHLREGWTRDRVIEAIRAEGIPCLSGSCSEVYLEKAFSDELRPSRKVRGSSRARRHESHVSRAPDPFRQRYDRYLSGGGEGSRGRDQLSLFRRRLSLIFHGRKNIGGPNPLKEHVVAEVNIQVSVVIPMRNEAKYIGRCLDSVLANDFPKDRLEILVVDGRSTDDSRAIVRAKGD